MQCDVDAVVRLVPWLSSKLSEERADLEARHRSLVEDLKLQVSLASAPRTAEPFPAALESRAAAKPKTQPSHADAMRRACQDPARDSVPLTFHQTPTDATEVGLSETGDTLQSDPSAGSATKPVPGTTSASLSAKRIGRGGPAKPCRRTPGGENSTVGGAQAVTSTTFDVMMRAKSKYITKSLEDLVVPDNALHRFVMSRGFESFFAVVIVFNMVVMAVECQYIGIGLGHRIGYDGYPEPRETAWPGVGTALEVLDYIFGCLYTVEFIVKFVGLRLAYCDTWNVFDLFIVVIWYVDKALAHVDLPIDMMILRCLRLARLMRLLKIIKTISGFDQLFLMITALKGSFYMLSWTALLITTCMITFAFLFNQALVTYVIDDEHASSEKKLRCFQLFGSFSRALFTMFEITLANWIPVARFLTEEVSEFFIIFAVLYKLTFGFSLIAVINGCFIKETFKIAETDDLLMILQKTKESSIHVEKMSTLLAAIDDSGDGTVDRVEWEMACQDVEVKHWLAAQGLNANDASTIFTLMDDGTGSMSAMDLAKHVARLKGPASSLALAIASRNATQSEERLIRRINDALKVANTTKAAVEGLSRCIASQGSKVLKGAAEEVNQIVDLRGKTGCYHIPSKVPKDDCEFPAGGTW